MLAWLPLRRLRRHMQQNRSKAIKRSAPKSEPTTIPAIRPPERPELWDAPLDGDAVLLEVDDGKKGGKEVVDGNVTPGHRLVTFAPTQHESVALGELVAQ